MESEKQDGIWVQASTPIIRQISDERLLKAARGLYQALWYCYSNVRDAVQCGVDISELLGEMEIKARKALEEAESIEPAIAQEQANED